MSLQTKQNLFNFMQRVDLKGNEVPAFNECMIELQNEIQAEQAKKAGQEEQEEQQKGQEKPDVHKSDVESETPGDEHE